MEVQVETLHLFLKQDEYLLLSRALDFAKDHWKVPHNQDPFGPELENFANSIHDMGEEFGIL